MEPEGRPFHRLDVAVIPQAGKTRITIHIDTDVLDTFRHRAERSGTGYQTMINQALREYLDKSSTPVDETTLRRVIREELQRARHLDGSSHVSKA